MTVFTVKHGGRPGQAHARAPVVQIGAVIGRALRAEAAATQDIDDSGAIQDFVRNRIVLIPQPQVQSKSRAHLEFVLRITRIEGAPGADHALALQIRGRRRRVVNEILGGVVAEGGGGQGVAELSRRMRRMSTPILMVWPAADHGEVIDVGEAGADLGVQRGVAEAVEGAGAHGDGRGAIGPVVVVGAIQSKPDLVISSRREDVLVFEDDVGRDVGNYVVVSEGVQWNVDVSVCRRCSARRPCSRR